MIGDNYTEFMKKCENSPWCGVIWSAPNKTFCAMRYESSKGWVILPPETVEWLKRVKQATVEEVCDHAGGATGNILWRQFSNYMGYKS